MFCLAEAVESNRVRLADLKEDDEPRDILCQIMKYSLNEDHSLVYVWDGSDFPIHSNILTLFEDSDSRNYSPALEYHSEIGRLTKIEEDPIYSCGSLVPLSLDPFINESMLPRKSWVLVSDLDVP